MDVGTFLERANAASQERFIEDKRVLSFSQYLEQFARRPALLGRNAAQYLKDVVDCHGHETVVSPRGELTHYRLFDQPFAGGRDRLIGQEEVQHGFYQSLSNAVREGRAGRLILLHGPNGSAKTSFVRCLAEAMVDYSLREEGALYTFNWVFPKSSYEGKRVGFDAGEGRRPPQESYAFLDEQLVAARLPAELRDHPLFLLPAADRGEFLSSLGELPDGFRFGENVLRGNLGPVSRRIFDALLAAYSGDMARVLAHVQVERYYLSRRYRSGLVTVEPQMHVDATSRQVTMDESFGNLPPVLRHIPLFDIGGDLVDAHRGMLEFSDLLKRPLDALKYLLGTCEDGRANVGGAILFLDIVFLGTTNDKYLQAFAKTPDFSSFKGRLETVRVPYLRDYRAEQAIYDTQITKEVAGKHIAPHATDVAAFWAVLTRMRPADPALYPEALRPALKELTPAAKAELYATGLPPAGLAPETARELVQAIPTLAEESRGEPDYEGGFGASPREGKAVLLDAAHNGEDGCLHPVQVLRSIKDLLEQKSLYSFLQIPAAGDYANQEKLLEAVERRTLEAVDREFKQAMGLVTDEDFQKLLHQYARHASAFLKKEQVLDPVTRQLTDPDESFMKSLEKDWGTSANPDRARQEFLGRIAAFSLDHPGIEVPYPVLFADHFEKLRSAYYTEKESDLQHTLSRVLEHLEGAKLPAAQVTEVEAVLANLKEQAGYCDNCVGPALSFYARGRESLVKA